MYNTYQIAALKNSSWNKIIGVARGLAGPAMAGPLFYWLNTNPMVQHSLTGPVIYF